jgi:hypothetical protein
MKEYCKRIASKALRRRNFIHLHFFAWVIYLWAIYTFQKVDATEEKKCIQSLVWKFWDRKKISVNRYWLQIYSNWVKKTFPPASKRQKSFLYPFSRIPIMTDMASRTANDKKKIDPDEFMVEKLLSDL